MNTIAFENPIETYIRLIYVLFMNLLLKGMTSQQQREICIDICYTLESPEQSLHMYKQDFQLNKLPGLAVAIGALEKIKIKT